MFSYLSIVPFVEEAVHGPNVKGSAPISEDILENPIKVLQVNKNNLFNILMHLIYIILFCGKNYYEEFLKSIKKLKKYKMYSEESIDEAMGLILRFLIPVIIQTGLISVF